MAKNINKNKSTITGGDKYIDTPDFGRLFVNLDKKKIKELKKSAIDLELPVDDILHIAIDLFLDIFNKTSSKDIEEKGVDALFKRK